MILILSGTITLVISSSKNLYVKNFMDRLVLKSPVIGKLILFSQTKDFCFSMKLLSSAYYPLTKSLMLSSDAASNTCYKAAIKNVCKKIMNGEDAGKSFFEEKIFPAYFVTWIKLCEKDGNIHNAFSQCYEYFREENERVLSRTSVMAEPFFILTTGIVIFIIIAQFVLPVFSLLGEL